MHRSKTIKNHTIMWIAIIGISLTAFLTALDFAIVNTALPRIQSSLHASLSACQWIMSSYVLVISVLLIAMGRMADNMGHKPFLLLGTSLFLLASLLAGYATSPWWLIAMRALQGVGSAIILPSSLALLSGQCHHVERKKAFAIWTAINGLGFALGPVLGGYLSFHINWSWVFWINLPIGALALASICFLIPSTDHATPTNTALPPFDYTGLITLMLGLGCMMLSITQGADWGWSSHTTLFTAGIAVISLALCYRTQRTQKNPLLNLNAFKHPAFLMGASANTLSVILAYVLFFLIPLYLHQVMHMTVSQIGLFLLAITLSMTIASPLTGHALKRVAPPCCILVGMVLLTLSVLCQMIFAGTMQLNYLYLACISMGLGWGITWGSATAYAIDALPKTMNGTASATLWTLQNMMGAVVLACSSALLHQRYVQRMTDLIKQSPMHTPKLNAMLDPETFNPIQPHWVSLYQHAFTYGYQSCMTLLAGIALLLLCTVIFMQYQRVK